MEWTEGVFVNEVVVIKTEFVVGVVSSSSRAVYVSVDVGVYAFINVFTELCKYRFSNGRVFMCCCCCCYCAFVFGKCVDVWMCMCKQWMIR